MTTEHVIRFFSHKAISISWLAFQVYGENTPNSRSKIGKRRLGGAPWTYLEIIKLKELYVELIQISD
jgi:hypothetical protein